MARCNNDMIKESTYWDEMYLQLKDRNHTIIVFEDWSFKNVYDDILSKKLDNPEKYTVFTSIESSIVDSGGKKALYETFDYLKEKSIINSNLIIVADLDYDKITKNINYIKYKSYSNFIYLNTYSFENYFVNIDLLINVLFKSHTKQPTKLWIKDKVKYDQWEYSIAEEYCNILPKLITLISINEGCGFQSKDIKDLFNSDPLSPTCVSNMIDLKISNLECQRESFVVFNKMYYTITKEFEKYFDHPKMILPLIPGKLLLQHYIKFYLHKMDTVLRCNNCPRKRNPPKKCYKNTKHKICSNIVYNYSNETFMKTHSSNYHFFDGEIKYLLDKIQIIYDSNNKNSLH